VRSAFGFDEFRDSTDITSVLREGRTWSDVSQTRTIDIDLNRRFFSGKSAALKCISATLAPAHTIRIATAYFEPSGFQCLQDVLAGKQVRLLVGREEGGRDRAEEVISEFVDNLAVHPIERRMRAMRLMLEALENNLLLVSVGHTIDDAALLDARYLYHHAKLYIADEDAAAVTSANMSHHGLVVSREAGYVVVERDDIRYFVQQFDQYFEQSESITQALIEKLRAYVTAYPPFDVYVRALIELYGLPEDEVPAQLPQLARYQRPVVSRTLQSLMDYKGAMLIASTGLGKTVMAAHIVAYLRMQNVIDRVIIVSPAGLRETWRRFMRAAVTSSAEFSYNTLSGVEPARNYSVRNLEYDLRHVTPKTLIILDESHHMRNADGTGGDRKLRYQRIESAIHRSGAQLLMLTATPFSRSIHDVNAQLRLLPRSGIPSRKQLFNIPTYWKVDSSDELPELPPCAVLTTPSVVSHFSERDASGERYVIFADGDRRYFPRRLQFRTEVYENPMDDILVELLSSRLLDREKQPTQQQQLFDKNEVTNGQTVGFFNAEIMRQFCSSPVQVEDSFAKLRKFGGFDKMRFARQKELTQFVDRYLYQVKQYQHLEYDRKLRRVLEIIRQSGDEKVVIFCHYRETAKALADAITNSLPEICAETTADRDIDTIDNLLRRFAPIANDIPEYERLEDAIHVLVATGALAEGFNLQDASILINYDLPWTVLILAQRMGRVLRPWKEPREISIYNFVPSTMSNPQVHMAMNWERRLLERNRQHQSFADIPVLLETDQRVSEVGHEMIDLARQLRAHDHNVNLDLDETMRFIENAEKLQTSSFLDDLAVLSVEDRLRVAQLPPGFRSARLGTGKAQLFVLLRHRRRHFAVLFDQDARIVMDNIRRDAIMNVIRCKHDEPIAPPSKYPDDDVLDEWLDRSLETWAQEHDVALNEIGIVCSLAIVS
jgi:superfamily II DNA or RNA helicase